MRYDIEHKARTRERVLREAAAAIRTDGPGRVGVAALMARAGLTHGGFYAHFGSKDDLLSEAVAYMFQDRYAAFFADVETVEPRSALRQFVDLYLSMRHRDARAKGCPVPILAGDIHRLPDAARVRFEEAVDQLVGGVTTLLRRSSVSEPDRVARSAVAEMVGAVALARTYADDSKAETLLADVRLSVETRFQII